MAHSNPDAEPDLDTPPSNAATANTSASRRSPNDPSRKPSITPIATAAPAQNKPATALPPAMPSSAGASPRTSRNASPERKDSRPPPLANPPSTQPSAAAIQRALSAASVPQLPAGGVSEAVSKLPKPPKSAGGSGDGTPRWPTSPRLKSPPPSVSNSRRGSNATQKKADNTTAPSISVQTATPQTPTPSPAKQGGDETAGVKGPQLQTPVKAPSRGASGKSVLETVQEISMDDVRQPSPAAIKAAADLKPLTRLSDEDGKVGKAASVNGDGETVSLHAESGSESAGAKTERKKREDTGSIATRPKNGTTKSYASLTSTKSRQADGKPNMTVETETVQSIPQSVLSTGDRSGSTRNENSGSVRLKPSNETIRPKKERKKTTQKTRSLNQGTARGRFFSSASRDVTSERYFSHTLTLPFRHMSRYRLFRTLSDIYARKASSRADIFEARVANAVDEANSSDSEETFVYESNPPEPPQRRARHHSRTPSVTSAHSVADGQRSAGMRSFGDAMDDRRVAGKRSMKFSNSAYNDVDSPDGNDGSVRSHTPRHFGRFGRGGSHASMFDPDSPFTQASKLRAQQLGTRHSRPGSPRSPQSASHQQQQQGRTNGLFGRKQEPSYDFDAEIGDDERTPLVSTVRTPRNGRLHRRISTRSGDGIDEYYGVRRNARCGRFGGCLLGFVVISAVVLSAIAFLAMSNRPMYDVKIRKIKNVLASEQELMLDLLVGAVNPNALGISVVDMDVNLFARSKHIEDDEVALTTSKSVEMKRRRRLRLDAPQSPNPTQPASDDENWQDLTSHWHAPITKPTTSGGGGGVDHGTDPPDFPDDDDDLDRDAQTMLLGTILHFDQGLEFEGSPLKRHVHYSVGELRLEKPGNKTVARGSEKWEIVLQHPFELLVRGVLKYHLPVSSRVESVAVSAAVLVHPEHDVDDFGNMRLEEVDDSEHWQWVDWGELTDGELDDVGSRLLEVGEEGRKYD